MFKFIKNIFSLFKKKDSGLITYAKSELKIIGEFDSKRGEFIIQFLKEFENSYKFFFDTSAELKTILSSINMLWNETPLSPLSGLSEWERISETKFRNTRLDGVFSDMNPVSNMREFYDLKAYKIIEYDEKGREIIKNANIKKIIEFPYIREVEFINLSTIPEEKDDY